MFERLTMRRDNEVFVNSEATGWTHNSNWSKPAQEAIDRLAAYEDSNSSPEEVQELAKAKADGRLVELPCKVGDTVYAVYGYLNKSIGTAIVKQICVRDNEIRVVLNNSIEKIWGRSVFATQEEAEKAIAEIGGREDV